MIVLYRYCLYAMSAMITSAQSLIRCKIPVIKLSVKLLQSLMFLTVV